LGQTSHPFMMRFLAACTFPVTSSSRAEAIQAGGWCGLVSLHRDGIFIPKTLRFEKMKFLHFERKTYKIYRYIMGGLCSAPYKKLNIWFYLGLHWMHHTDLAVDPVSDIHFPARYRMPKRLD
jgi:hypothetical protein